MTDAAELVALHGRMRRPLAAWFRGRAPADLEVDDLLQETFVRLHRALPTVRDLGAVEAIAWRTARSVLVDQLRRRRPSEPVPEDLVAEPVVDGPTVTDLVAAWVPGFVEALPEPYREAVRLADLEGVSQAELARRLGLSPSGARSRVQRGRAQLRDLMLACCEIRFDEGSVVDVSPRACPPAACR